MNRDITNGDKSANGIQLPQKQDNMGREKISTGCHYAALSVKSSVSTVVNGLSEKKLSLQD
ncbi:hypothetical protein [Algoriphagus persicinus]|uniref:hypothetical protein n=1 Tax=Algoriphagus persicinus TaxID=3108754 RepID=UPI002B3C1663|nr:hypothetical protein [Algoriphagus sp. E1-3-M2]MEB2786743.1 hypothetical protein [Algoriphagus sp. E1-3-M2]